MATSLESLASMPQTQQTSPQSQHAMSRSLQSLDSMSQPPQLLQQIQPQVPQMLPQMPAHIQPGVPVLETPAQSKPAVPRESLFKNHLQEYAQKAAIPLPSYHTINEGSSHAPQFRSTVVFNGATYTSPNVFLHRKVAEMDVARIALLSLAPQMRLLSSPQIKKESSLDQEDTIFCKQILNEYAVKINVQNPIYNTEKADGPIPGFVTSLTFIGKNYVGDKGRNKKESQQLVARAVIQSILDSDAHTVIAKIINSKRMLYAAKNKVKTMPVGIQTESSVDTDTSKDNELKVVMVNDNMPRTAIPEPCTGNLSNVSIKSVPLHEFKLRKQEALPIEGNGTRIIFVPPNSELVVMTSAKKRKRKPLKAKNKVGIDSQVQTAVVRPSQTTTHTVAQSVPNNCVSLQGFGNAVSSKT